MFPDKNPDREHLHGLIMEQACVAAEYHAIGDDQMVYAHAVQVGNLIADLGDLIRAERDA